MNTPEEWWGLVESNKEALKSLVMNYYPGVRERTLEDEIDLPITAAGAEHACTVVRAQILRNPERPMPEQFDQLLVARDKKLSSLFSSTWFGIPESYNARFLEGFGVLCDLCEESYLLYEDEIPD